MNKNFNEFCAQLGCSTYHPLAAYMFQRQELSDPAKAALLLGFVNSEQYLSVMTNCRELTELEKIQMSQAVGAPFVGFISQRIKDWASDLESSQMINRWEIWNKYLQGRFCELGMLPTVADLLYDLASPEIEHQNALFQSSQPHGVEPLQHILRSFVADRVDSDYESLVARGEADADACQRAYKLLDQIENNVLDRDPHDLVTLGMVGALLLGLVILIKK